MWAVGEEQWQSSIRGMERPGKTKKEMGKDKDAHSNWARWAVTGARYLSGDEDLNLLQQTSSRLTELCIQNIWNN